MAWPSSTAGSPSTRFTPNSARYQHLDGTKIAENWTALTTGALAAPTLSNVNGQLVPDEANLHSATTSTGALWDDHAFVCTCNDWQEASEIELTGGGTGLKGDLMWAQGFAGLTCNESMALIRVQHSWARYCRAHR